MASSSSAARVVQKPIPVTIGSDLEKEVQTMAWKRKELQIEQKKVQLRGAERLQVAEERYKAIRAQQASDRENQADMLQKEVANAQAHLWKSQQAHDITMEELQDQASEEENRAAEHSAQRQQSMQSVNEVRDQGAQHSAWTDEQMNLRMEAAEQSVATLRDETRDRLGTDRQQREDWQAQRKREMLARAEDAHRFADEIGLHSTTEALKLETYRHREATAIDRVAELAQATRTAAQATMRRHEDKAVEHAKELKGLTHQVRIRTDTALAEKMTGTAKELNEAKLFVDKVKRDLASMTLEFHLKVSDAEEQAGHTTREAARRVQALENAVNDGFFGSRQALIEADQRNRANREAMEAELEADQRNRANREAMEAELEALEQKFQSVEEATKKRCEDILVRWAAERNKACETTKRLEEKGHAAVKDVEAVLQKFAKENLVLTVDVREGCSETAAQLHRQAATAARRTLLAAEEAKLADDKAAEAATAELHTLREKVAAFEAAADAEIEAELAKAAECEFHVRQETEEHANAAKELTKEAHAKEKTFISESATAWAQVRKACYQLRLANLHDFAQGIVSGEFDDHEEGSLQLVY